MDTVSRYNYIKNAYEHMKNWLAQGNAVLRQLKRYVHRHFKVPPTLHESLDPADARDVLITFGYHYVDSLLRYCSDELKTGITCLFWHTNFLDSLMYLAS